jgi:hypothetical protein
MTMTVMMTTMMMMTMTMMMMMMMMMMNGRDSYRRSSGLGLSHGDDIAASVDDH